MWVTSELSSQCGPIPRPKIHRTSTLKPKSLIWAINEFYFAIPRHKLFRCLIEFPIKHDIATIPSSPSKYVWNSPNVAPPLPPPYPLQSRHSVALPLPRRYRHPAGSQTLQMAYPRQVLPVCLRKFHWAPDRQNQSHHRDVLHKTRKGEGRKGEFGVEDAQDAHLGAAGYQGGD